MAHSNQVREFLMTSDGIKLRKVYVGPEGVLTGSARLAREAKDRADRLLRDQELERRTREMDRRRREIKAQIEVLQAQLTSEEDEAALLNREGNTREDVLSADRVAMASSRSSSRETAVATTSIKSKK
jgi:circadian clock protein KaiC